jgi:hypothetical protein
MFFPFFIDVVVMNKIKENNCDSECCMERKYCMFVGTKK